MKTGVSFFADTDFLQTVIKLLEEGQIDFLEWSFDTAWGSAQIPGWARDLLKEFSTQGALLGHGVSYSFLSGDDRTKYHQDWLRRLELEVSELKYQHVTEHFGFSSGGDFHHNTPLPVPLTAQNLRFAVENINRLQDAAGVAVGIENLAFCFSETDIRQQADFITKIIEQTGAFLLCDLHNLYCQSANFDVPLLELFSYYPAEHIREVHVSGGSWAEVAVAAQDKLIRRDTHNDAVPDEVFEFLPDVLSKCSGLEYVVLEQLSESLRTPDAKQSFENDYLKLRRICG